MNAPPGGLSGFDALEATGHLDGFSWEYVAPEDACSVGLALHGQTFGSLAELYEHLPEWDENPACTRRPCACTALPLRLAGDGGR